MYLGRIGDGYFWIIESSNAFYVYYRGAKSAWKAKYIGKEQTLSRVTFLIASVAGFDKLVEINRKIDAAYRHTMHILRMSIEAFIKFVLHNKPEWRMFVPKELIELLEGPGTKRGNDDDG